MASSGLIPRLIARRRSRRRAAVPAVLAPEQVPPGLSVVMAAHDEAAQLEECLAHLRGWCEEVVVVDAASTDETAAVAKRGADRVISAPNHPMLEINKNVAMAAASHSWILVLDPDERVSPQLRQQIREVVDRDERVLTGFWMPRRNYVLGSWMRTMGMYPGAQLRLVRRGCGAFSESDHHLPMAVAGTHGYLTGDLIHLSDRTVSEIAAKRRRYAKFAAQQMHERGERFHPHRLLTEPARVILRQFLFEGGWLEGRRGAIYAGLSAYGAFLRHARLRELERARR